MFISPAYAQAGEAAGGSDFFIQILPLALIFVVFYFLLIRPQQKKMKTHREMISAIRRGDSIVTAGGLLGKVTKVIDDNTLQLEIAEGVRVRVVKSTVSEVRSRGEPVKGDEGGDKEPATAEKPTSLLSKLTGKK